MFCISNSRIASSIGDVFAKMGGTYASLKILGSIISNIFTSIIFQSSLIRKLYHFRPTLPGEQKPQKIKNN